MEERGKRRGLGLAAALVAVALLSLPANAGARPIVSVGSSSLPDFTGHASAHRIKHPTHSERNPFMAPNPNSNIHNDTWMTDSYNRPGPTGKSLEASSYSENPALCGSLAFDPKGRIVTVCPSLLAIPPEARILDPKTLKPISTYELPTAPSPPGTQEYQNFAGGGYFYLDQKARIVVATRTDHIFVLDEGPDGDTLTLRRDYDLTSVLNTTSERITSALPDFHGLIWFVAKSSGKVGTLNQRTGALHVYNLHEEIENSFAVGSKGVYIVSDKRMYEFKAGKSGRPRVIWKKGYPNSGIVKPSQVDAGSGTTPTVMQGGYVAIADNADPMNVVVYRTAKHLHGRRRTVCKVPVFSKGTSATENTLIGSKRSLIVENNYGYQNPFGPMSGAVTKAGFARVDIGRNGKGCRKVWTNTSVRAPSAVPKLSTKTGLIYTYTRPPDPNGSEGYFWTALDFRTGRTAWSKYSGSGLPFNNNYAGVALGPDGTAYLGVTGGIITLKDR